MTIVADAPGYTDAVGPVLLPGVHPFDTRLHTEPCLDVASAVRAQGAVYPPLEVRGTRKAFRAWYDSDEYLGRWVVTVDGAVAAHVGLTAPSAAVGYALDGAAGCAEISRLCVHPDYRRHGIGARLVATAVACARSLRLVPVAAALDPAAIRLYESTGWDCRSGFFDDQGLNHVFVR